MNRPGGDPWASTLAMVKPGDVVMIQFGHNDEGKPDDPLRACASLPGTGEETVEIENPLLKMHETVHTYGWYIRKIVQDTKAKGGYPHRLLPDSAQVVAGRQGDPQHRQLLLAGRAKWQLKRAWDLSI